MYTAFSFVGSQPVAAGVTPLLNLYPNARGAYSLRLIRSAYTGSAIRVRRTPSNSEQDIGFNATGELDTAALTSFVGTGSGFVTTWYDQSGVGFNPTQATAADQPSIVTTGSVNLVNNKPAVYFQDSSDILTFTTSSFTSASFSQLAVFQFQFRSGTLARPIVAYGNTGVANISGLTGQNNFRAIYSGAPANNSDDGALTLNQEAWLSAVTSSATKLYVNGASVNLTASGSSTRLVNQNLITLGGDTNGSPMYPGYIQEAVTWFSYQDANATGIASNVNSYYGIY